MGLTVPIAWAVVRVYRRAGLYFQWKSAWGEGKGRSRLGQSLPFVDTANTGTFRGIYRPRQTDSIREVIWMVRAFH